jgi:UDP-N-acetylglucosamine 2-epimerase
VSDYFPSEQLEHFNKEAIRWLHDWSQNEFAEDVPLAKYFQIGYCSLWWISGYLYFYSDILAIISTIQIIKTILETENFKSVIIPNVWKRPSVSSQLSLNDMNFPYKLLKSVCEELNLKIESVPVSFHASKRWHISYVKNLMHTFIFRNIYLYCIEKYRRLIVRFNVPRGEVSPDSKDQKQKIFILSPSKNWGSVFDLKSGVKIQGDSKVGYLYQKLSKMTDTELIGIDCNSLPAGEFKILSKKLVADKYLTWRSLQSLINAEVMKKAYSIKKSHSQKAEKLIGAQNFKNSFVYNGINFHKLLSSRIKFVFNTLLPHGALYKFYYESIFRQIQPKLIIATYETGLHGRAVTAAAYETGVPVLGIQHGKIHPSHPQYIHKNVNPRDKLNVLFAPIADMTCVFGEYTKNVLVNDSAYPEEHISVTGQIATDAIALSAKLYNVKRFVSQYKLNKNQKTVCLLSQNFDNPGDLERFFRVTCEGLNHFPQYNFLIKMHPRQSIQTAEYFVRKYFQQPEKVRILKSVDLYEVIYNSDIIITGNSTVGVEAMIFRKPLITIEGFKYSMEYAEQGASLGIMTSAEMVTAVKNISNDPDIREQLLRNSERYLAFHLYKIDGNVCERIINEGDKLIHKFRNDELNRL